MAALRVGGKLMTTLTATAARSSFRFALDIDGWSELSAWGYDEGLESYFAQLWRDGDPVNSNPTVWLMGYDPRYTRREDLFAAILATTHAAPLNILRALGGDREQPPAIRPGAAPILAHRHAIARHDTDSFYLRGAAEALAWLAAEAPHGPLTGQKSPPRGPGFLEVEAERWAASAAAHQRRDLPRDWFAGIETTLRWANGQAASPW
ncbi:hypothetical protein [Streptomyces sp. NPDC056883]|uniref:hypothetical protein n=1 Tax=Streptomyces sp. NPDC056883 TaxID=3345959 RepID=UPI0036AB25CE